MVVDDYDALNKHMDCEMKHRGSCSGGRGREKKCLIPVIASIPSQRSRSPKGPLVFVNVILTFAFNTPLRRSTRSKKQKQKVFQFFIYVVEFSI